MVTGITGGVGSGKSTVSRYLTDHCGFVLIDTDQTAAGLMEPGHEAYTELVKAFGDSILEMPGGRISRKAFAGVIYQSEEARKLSDSIVHPLVWDEAERRIAELTADDPECRIAVETAVPEARFRDLCDRIWFVYCDPETRIGRLGKTRGYSREYALQIINSQITDEEFFGMADAVIDNSGFPEETKDQIGRLL